MQYRYGYDCDAARAVLSMCTMYQNDILQCNGFQIIMFLGLLDRKSAEDHENIKGLKSDSDRVFGILQCTYNYYGSIRAIPTCLSTS